MYIYKFLLFFLFLFFFSCSEKTIEFANGEKSLEKLVNSITTAIKKNDEPLFRQKMITKKEFIKLVYPHLPEKKSGISGIDYWGLMIPDMIKGPRRALRKFANYEFVKIGQPKKVLHYGEIKIYRDIPITFKKDDNEISTSEIFKAIVEYKGSFKLFNITFE